MKLQTPQLYLIFTTLANPWYVNVSVQALTSNAKESPQILNTNICSTAQGRTSKCEVELDVPASCVKTDATSDCPIVFFFHGAGGTNDWFAKTSGVHEANMIGVYPQGENGWNTGPKDSNVCQWDDFSCTEDPDEGAFIAAIIKELRDELGANGNIYLNGNSNGAALSMRIASNAGADLPIRGVITKVTQLLASPPRSGPGVLNYNQPEAGGPKVSVLNLMGTEDKVIPYEGGSSSVFGQDENFQLMAALESMAMWALHNDCSEDAPEITTGVVYSNSEDANGEATFYSYQGCPEGVIVEHYALHGAGHTFGQKAALDGVEIDYAMAFEFINRLEGTDLPVVPSPVASPGGGGDDNSACEDDPEWHGKFNADHTCDYVAESPSSRCNWENTDGVKASKACKVACDECDTGGRDPVTTSSPTASPIENLYCEDDPLWHGKMNAEHDCDFVALDPLVRCNWVSSDGFKAMDACEKACGEDCLL
eukprot:CAMPEP_0116042298 /NCGR_PEP_ID=MMETSP0321-20121206/25599_1 /TAXON_ID=163516 /ORGANISM="Leptocylindrus danicus var. danicus, Strain B650" /LENGTH=480 /DNA_ID=CAMNT_0003522733 /DNA_START=34 /DNA_END=1476 /DNA_ORIENTATION=-